ncbi:hypothetical protein Peur_033757 [Populus x canadensis]
MKSVSTEINLSQTSLCARCGCQVESVHLLFDSYWARQLWMKLLPSSEVPNFFQGDTMVWLEWSVSSRAAELVSRKVPDVDWWKLNVDGSVLATSGAAGIG